MRFLGQLITNKKTALFIDKCIKRAPPLWPELGLSRIGPKFLQDSRIKRCLPDIDDKGWKDYDRQFFWAVCYTMHPSYTQKVVKEAKRLRMRTPKKPVPVLQEIISDQWADLLLQEEFQSCKCKRQDRHQTKMSKIASAQSSSIFSKLAIIFIPSLDFLILCRHHRLSLCQPENYRNGQEGNTE